MHHNKNNNINLNIIPLFCCFFLACTKVPRAIVVVGWLVDFGFNGPLRQYFSLYRVVSQREGERGKKG